MKIRDRKKLHKIKQVIRESDYLLGLMYVSDDKQHKKLIPKGERVVAHKKLELAAFYRKHPEAKVA